jgi:beta-aspartyl-peptidase (threonine type)
VHGGAFNIEPDRRAAHREGCLRALDVGIRTLRGGGSSLDAVVEAVAALEDDETFDAGRGSFLNERGSVALDAGIMDGRTLAVGSVAHVERVPNAVRLARAVLESPHAALVGEGAYLFALDNEIETCAPEELVCERERLRWETTRHIDRSSWAQELFGDTVGAVAVDSFGNLAAATSTGGSPLKPVGRVGDSPWIGAGLYADNQSGAVSATGHGERIIPLVWSKAIADLMESGLHGRDAASAAINMLERLDARAGVIVLDPLGHVGVAYNTPAMAYAYLDTEVDEIRSGPD